MKVVTQKLTVSENYKLTAKLQKHLHDLFGEGNWGVIVYREINSWFDENDVCRVSANITLSWNKPNGTQIITHQSSIKVLQKTGILDYEKEGSRALTHTIKKAAALLKSNKQGGSANGV